MKRDTEDLLLEFCVQQKERFGLSPWLDLPLSSDTKATTALYLANTSWFGHRHELLDVAEKLHRGCVGHFSEMARLTGFDPSRFRGRLQSRLAHEQSVS
ncbi:MAG: hypothetical protein ABSF76_15000 [Opitutaceae bacterium]|jgi:hypothetical protein